jgi:hypothetical protein
VQHGHLLAAELLGGIKDYLLDGVGSREAHHK